MHTREIGFAIGVSLSFSATRSERVKKIVENFIAEIFVFTDDLETRADRQ